MKISLTLKMSERSRASSALFSTQRSYEYAPGRQLRHVGMLCRAMSRPTPALMAAALRVLGYLDRTKDIGLRYEASDVELYGMSDSDWGVKHSTSG